VVAAVATGAACRDGPGGDAKVTSDDASVDYADAVEPGDSQVGDGGASGHSCNDDFGSAPDPATCCPTPTCGATDDFCMPSGITQTRPSMIV
jgi:hypothetical protein